MVLVVLSIEVHERIEILDLKPAFSLLKRGEDIRDGFVICFDLGPAINLDSATMRQRGHSAALNPQHDPN
jgi:hypothetical protein